MLPMSCLFLASTQRAVINSEGTNFRSLLSVRPQSAPSFGAVSAFATTSPATSHWRKRWLQTSCDRRYALGDPGTSTLEPLTILFCGRDAFSCTVFKHVYEARDVWQNLLVATNADVRTGRNGSRLAISPLKTLSETLAVPVHVIPKEKAAFRRWLPPSPFGPPDGVLGADALPHPSRLHVLITASFGRILPSAILRLFPATQCLNVHPSLLPAYRGPAPIQRALMAGETETGACVIQMGDVRPREGKVVDEGSIWAVERMGIPENATFTDMQTKLADSGGKLLVQVLRDMRTGEARRTSQASTNSTTPYAAAITSPDSAISFSVHTATTIARLERAIGHQRALTVHHALPDGRAVSISGLRTIPAGSDLEHGLTNARPGTAKYSRAISTLLVACMGGEVLGIDRLQTQDRPMLTAKEWWNGVKGMGLVQEGVFRFRGNDGH